MKKRGKQAAAWMLSVLMLFAGSSMALSAEAVAQEQGTGWSDNRVGAKVRDRSGNRGKSESGWQPEAVRVPESVRWPGAAGMQERMQCPEASEATGEIRCPEVAEATGKKRCPEVAEVTKIPEQTRRPEAVRDPEQTRRKEPGMVRGQKPGR